MSDISQNGVITDQSTKLCNHCKCLLSIMEFSKATNNKDGLQRICKKCSSILNKKWVLNNPDRQKKRVADWASNNKDIRNESQRRDYSLKPIKTRHRKMKRFWPNHTIAEALLEYNAIRERQGDRCGVCNIHANEMCEDFSIDHDHNTGMVRGLLCRKCNAGIGMLGDTLDGVQKAVIYLKGLTGE